MNVARLPHGNTAYIKEQLFSRFSIKRCRFAENRCQCRPDRAKRPDAAAIS
jgi:hypothetical protein